jgi:hypothetical protein
MLQTDPPTFGTMHGNCEWAKDFSVGDELWLHDIFGPLKGRPNIKLRIRSIKRTAVELDRAHE